MKDRTTVALVGLLLGVVPAGGGEDLQSRLVAEHTNAAGTLTLKTPADWAFESRAGQPEVTEVRGGPLLIRILRREGELGLDSYHVQCMAERLSDPMKADPHVDYEYDFLEGWVGERHVLDSAFVVRYDEAVEGHAEWRQRCMTVVGGGESLCVIGMAPRQVWKKSKKDRALLEAVMASIRLD
jgi:hypothetical protein